MGPGLDAKKSASQDKGTMPEDILKAWGDVWLVWQLYISDLVVVSRISGGIQACVKQYTCKIFVMKEYGSPSSDWVNVDNMLKKKVQFGLRPS